MWHSYLNKTESIIKTQHLISGIFLLSSLSFAQVDKSIELKEFSVGKAWFYNDTSDAIGIVNANYWYSISDITLDGNFVEKVLKASELKYIWLTRIEIDDGIINKIKEAKRIYFLGFGYAEENLKLLKIPEVLSKGQKIFGTALGFYEEEIIRTKFKLNGKWVNNFHSDMILENCDCLSLLRKYL